MTMTHIEIFIFITAEVFCLNNLLSTNKVENKMSWFSLITMHTFLNLSIGVSKKVYWSQRLRKKKNWTSKQLELQGPRVRTMNVMQKRLLNDLKQICIYLRHKGNKSDMTPALAAKLVFCVQYLTSHDHPQRSPSMLDTSCLKSLPLPSCTTPFTAFSLLLLLMILTIVLSLLLMIFCFILFCFAASEWVKWGRKWANAHNCLPCWDVYGPPHA